MNCLTEIIAVLTEFRRVARQLEPDQHVTLSRASHVFVELYETMQIMPGDMVPSTTMFYDLSTGANVHSFAFPEPSARPSVPSAARYDKERREERRVILLHLAAILDVNECELDFLGENESAREGYFSLLYDSLIGELRALDDTVSISGSCLQVLFELFHDEMRNSLKRDGRKEPDEALHYWRRANECANAVSSVPFNILVRAFLASQASSAAAERFFSDLGRRKGSKSQSLLSSTTEMCELWYASPKGRELYKNCSKNSYFGLG
ncbi:Ribonuclease H-like protein [Gracilaria domingensis]|nr:Ribonuclease H-like protein [Gracilaria domingensis]